MAGQLVKLCLTRVGEIRAVAFASWFGEAAAGRQAQWG